jgi:hypothetical protein
MSKTGFSFSVALVEEARGFDNHCAKETLLWPEGIRAFLGMRKK